MRTRTQAFIRTETSSVITAEKDRARKAHLTAMYEAVCTALYRKEVRDHRAQRNPRLLGLGPLRPTRSNYLAALWLANACKAADTYVESCKPRSPATAKRLWARYATGLLRDSLNDLQPEHDTDANAVLMLNLYTGRCKFLGAEWRTFRALEMEANA